MKLTLNAKILRIILFVSMVLIVAGAAAGFIFARKELQAFATSISQLEADAASVDSNVETLKQLETTVKENGDIKAKAEAIAVPASQYPVAVIANITEIANQAGVSLTSINYGDGAGNTASGTPQTTPTTDGTSAVPGSTPAPAAGATPSGVTKKTVNVTTESPVNYDALMKFIKGIETDDMFMHITKISLTKGIDNSVNTQPFTVEVYVR